MANGGDSLFRCSFSIYWYIPSLTTMQNSSALALAQILQGCPELVRVGHNDCCLHTFHGWAVYRHPCRTRVFNAYASEYLMFNSVT